MTDKRKPGSFLLPLIAKIRAERVGDDDVEQLSDAELLRSMAQGLSRHDDEFPLIACALALAFEHGPNEAEDPAKAADLLAEMGLEFAPAECAQSSAVRLVQNFDLNSVAYRPLSCRMRKWRRGTGACGIACCVPVRR
jgi:hypothetical protein